MMSLEFLKVDEGKTYTVWVEKENAFQAIHDELANDGVVMVGIGTTERGVFDHE